MNHINSVKRPGLGNKSPYELVEEDDEDFKALMSLLKMHLIPPDEVHLMPDLFVKKVIRPKLQIVIDLSIGIK